ncbi:MAG TPA: FGGY family carbohydrate kinase [Candidatus Limnocylindria bacterium]|nr:FGGY family carbohydrate kinase [Candidatus Limnocylindria bacterium]
MTARPRAVFLGIDVGTSGCKTVALSERGGVLASATRSYPTRYGADGEATQDAEDWLRAVRLTVRDCLEALGSTRVEAIGVTAPAHYAVLVGRDGRPLTRVLLASDGRPEATVAELRARIGDRFAEITLERLTGSWTFPQLVWLRRTVPGLWRRLRLVLVSKDYVRYRLTGDAATDPTDAAGTGLYDQRARVWSAPLLEEASLDIDRLPPIRGSLETGGVLGREWARHLGIPAGTPVTTGATDTASELVSVAALSPGDGIVKVASTATVVAVTASPRPHPALLTYPHAIPGRWYTLAATSSAATSLTWAHALMAGRGPADGAEYAGMAREAARVPPGSGGVIFLPFLLGERTPYWDRELRGAFVGLAASHGRAEAFRAVMEGVAFSLRSCRDLMAANGMHVPSPFLHGGGTAIRLWREIVLATLDVTGRLAEPHGPAVGAALLAAAGGSSGSLSRVHPRVREVRAPAGWAAAYDQAYPRYLAAAAALAETGREAARSARRDAPGALDIPV